MVRTAVVLGAGGLVGVAHHLGVLHALEVRAGFDAASAEVVIGTSAGAAVSALLRSGRRPVDLIDRLGDLARAGVSEPAAGGVALARRLLGSAYVVARSAPRFPVLSWLPPPPRAGSAAARAFPAGVLSMRAALSALATELPACWPERPTWLCALDLGARRRVVLDERAGGALGLVRAVQASCAIPGLYPPVRLGARLLVDGGAWSPSNLDLVAATGVDTAVCIAPLAFDPGRPPGPAAVASRSFAARALRRELEVARAAGVDVVVLAPGATEVRAHGANVMRARGLEEVAWTAYEATLGLLRSPGLARRLERLVASPGRRPAPRRE